MNFQIIKGKKGMSPLIVTILLVALAVSLGAMIMSWGSSELSTNQKGCEQTKIEPQQAFGQNLICYDQNNKKLKLLLKNTGTNALTGIQIKQINPDLTINEMRLPKSNIIPGASYEYILDFIKPEKTYIEIIPEIDFLGEKIMCVNNAIIIDNLGNC